jgi:disulfide bond formation protein DsbB
VSCKDVTFRIFGLSLATFNILINLILGVTTTKLFLIYEKNR